MRTSFEGIPSAAMIGIFQVDSLDLKMKLMPSPLLCLYALETLLPELIAETADNLNDRLGEVLPVIKKRPNNGACVSPQNHHLDGNRRRLMNRLRMRAKPLFTQPVLTIVHPVTCFLILA